MTELGYENPIRRIMGEYNSVQQYGADYARILMNWAIGKAPLDPEKDDPLPDWAVDVLLLGRLSYRARIRILLDHVGDILHYQKKVERDLWKESDTDMRKWKHEMAKETKKAKKGTK